MEEFKLNNVIVFNEDYKKVLSISNIDLILTSPPYNIGSKSPKKIGGRKLGKYDAKSWGAIEQYWDCLPQDQYENQQIDFLKWASNKIHKNGIIVYNHKIRRNNGESIHPYRWISKVDSLVLHEEIVWDQGSTCNHNQYYTYNHTERLFVLKHPKANVYFKNQDFFWKQVKNKGVSDIWHISRDKNNKKYKSNASMPERLARQIIRLWCPPNGLVCDPYLGAGTTAVAAIKEKRRFVGSEIKNGDSFFNGAIENIKNAIGVNYA